MERLGEKGRKEQSNGRSIESCSYGPVNAPFVFLRKPQRNYPQLDADSSLTRVPSRAIIPPLEPFISVVLWRSISG